MCSVVFSRFHIRRPQSFWTSEHVDFLDMLLSNDMLLHLLYNTVVWRNDMCIRCLDFYRWREMMLRVIVNFIPYHSQFRICVSIKVKISVNPLCSPRKIVSLKNWNVFFRFPWCPEKKKLFSYLWVESTCTYTENEQFRSRVQRAL